MSIQSLTSLDIKIPTLKSLKEMVKDFIAQQFLQMANKLHQEMMTKQSQ
jgi:hypothetical protein